jgi:hypothetical protein
MSCIFSHCSSAPLEPCDTPCLCCACCNATSSALTPHVNKQQHSCHIYELDIDGEAQGLSQGTQLHGAADTHRQQKEWRAGRDNRCGIHPLHLSGARNQAHHPVQPWQCSGPGADAPLLQVLSRHMSRAGLGRLHCCGRGASNMAPFNIFRFAGSCPRSCVAT